MSRLGRLHPAAPRPGRASAGSAARRPPQAKSPASTPPAPRAPVPARPAPPRLAVAALVAVAGFMAASVGPRAGAAHAAAAPPVDVPPQPYAAALAAPEAERVALAERLAHDGSARGLGLLWLLAHDVAPAVAEAAAQTAIARCAAESPDVCRASLQFCLRPDDGPGSWRARTHLRRLAPALALADASAAFRQDTVAYLAARLGTPQECLGARKLLRRLADDPDPITQQQAAAALLREER